MGSRPFPCPQNLDGTTPHSSGDAIKELLGPQGFRATARLSTHGLAPFTASAARPRLDSWHLQCLSQDAL